MVIRHHLLSSCQMSAAVPSAIINIIVVHPKSKSKLCVYTLPYIIIAVVRGGSTQPTSRPAGHRPLPFLPQGGGLSLLHYQELSTITPSYSSPQHNILGG